MDPGGKAVEKKSWRMPVFDGWVFIFIFNNLLTGVTTGCVLSGNLLDIKILVCFNTVTAATMLIYYFQSNWLMDRMIKQITSFQMLLNNSHQGEFTDEGEVEPSKQGHPLM